MRIFAFLSIVAGGFKSMAEGQCGEGEISIVGASTTERIVSAWVDSYSCPSLTFLIEDGGSSVGISRSCGTVQGAEPADIGSVTRLPLVAEASTDDNWNFDCERSLRTLIEVRTRTQL
jgi:ABC-type phosphate transport system substrate-binding protein